MDARPCGAALAALARDIHQRWTAAGGSEAALPEAAARALAAVALPSARALLAWIAADPSLPRHLEHENDYGQPTVTVHRDARLRIELICWRRGPVAAHDHSTAGAFRVLEGLRVHNVQRFEPAERRGPLQLGQLSRVGTELLDAGEVRPIEPGRAFIHELFLVAANCTTLSVRSAAAVSPAFGYEGPHLAIDGAFARGAARRLKALAFLEQLDRARWREALHEAARGPDVLSAWLALRHAALEGEPLQPVKWPDQLVKWPDQFARCLAQLSHKRRLEALVTADLPDEAALFTGLLWSGLAEVDALHTLQLHRRQPCSSSTLVSSTPCAPSSVQSRAPAP